MKQDCTNNNKIKENKYKILRMSLLLGNDEDRAETINNFEDAAREIDAMNDEIYIKDLEPKFYETTKIEEEEKKLASLVDYIGGRVEQRISLLSDFANVTGFDLSNLPPIKYYEKLDDYKERLSYIREYLNNTEQINELKKSVKAEEENLEKAYLKKATAEEVNLQNEEILQKRFESIFKSQENLEGITEENIDSILNEKIAQSEESKKSLDIFNKSFMTLTGSGISYEEEQEYRSYVESAKEIYYKNKEEEYILKIYKSLLIKEQEYNKILTKRELINNLLLERLELRKKLKIKEIDNLNNLYDLIEKQYEDIKRQKENITDIEDLTTAININKEKINELEQDNQKVEILALLREFNMIDTYDKVEKPKEEFFEEKIEQPQEEIKTPAPQNNSIFDQPKVEESSKIDLPDDLKQPTIDFDSTEMKKEEPTEESKEDSSQQIKLPDIFGSNPLQNDEEPLPKTEEEPAKDNQIIQIEDAKNIDLDLIHSKSNKVMKRVGEMLGIKTEETKIVSVNAPTESNQEEQPSEKVSPIAENPLFNNTNSSETPNKVEETNNFWFQNDSTNTLNELPDLPVSNDNFFANNNVPDFNFPDLNFDFEKNNTEEKE